MINYNVKGESKMTKYVHVNDELSINVKDAVYVKIGSYNKHRTNYYYVDVDYKDSLKTIIVGSCNEKNDEKNFEYNRQLKDFMLEVLKNKKNSY